MEQGEAGDRRILPYGFDSRNPAASGYKRSIHQHLFKYDARFSKRSVPHLNWAGHSSGRISASVHAVVDHVERHRTIFRLHPTGTSGIWGGKYQPPLSSDSRDLIFRFFHSRERQNEFADLIKPGGHSALHGSSREIKRRIAEYCRIWNSSPIRSPISRVMEKAYPSYCGNMQSWVEDC